eukprot:s3785_g12.t1
MLAEICKSLGLEDLVMHPCAENSARALHWLTLAILVALCRCQQSMPQMTAGRHDPTDDRGALPPPGGCLPLVTPKLRGGEAATINMPALQSVSASKMLLCLFSSLQL